MQIKLYKFDSLSDKAKEYAINEFIQSFEQEKLSFIKEYFKKNEYLFLENGSVAIKKG